MSLCVCPCLFICVYDGGGGPGGGGGGGGGDSGLEKN